MRNDNKKHWQLVQSAAYNNEFYLQELLASEPSLISISEVKEGSEPLVVAIREFPVKIGAIDILGFTKNGDLAVIECKLATNPEVKRKVIGQVMEYGASLWNISYEELDSIVKTKTNLSLVNLILEEIDDEDWDEEAFRTNIEQNLIDGNFILMIVVDEVNEDLSRIIRFLNSAGHPSYSIAALEMRRFKLNETRDARPSYLRDRENLATVIQ